MEIVSEKEKYDYMIKTMEVGGDIYENVDLKRALDKLESKDRTIIILKYFEGMKFEEIANILDENVSTIKTRHYRSMKKLKDML